MPRRSLCLLALAACSRTEEPVDRRVPVQWVQGDPERESWELAQEGLWWGLSYLGARLPPDAGIVDVDGDDEVVRFTLDLDAVGLSAEALTVLDAALEPVFASDEMALYGHVDLGRLLARLIYDPWTYYAITDACLRQEDWPPRHGSAEPTRFGVTDSAIAEGHRVIHFEAAPANVSSIGFAADEGTGSLLDGDFVAHGVEVLDYLPNAQQRFAIYDAYGDLAAAVDPAFAPAGQPGKCMWCHEGTLIPAFRASEPVEGSIDWERFNAHVDEQQAMVEDARALQITAIDWSDRTAHEKTEILVEQFLDAPIPRLAREWGLSEADLSALVAERGLARDGEYEHLGPVVRRADADALLVELLADGRLPVGPVDGFVPLPVAYSTREHDPLARPERWITPFLGCD